MAEARVLNGDSRRVLRLMRAMGVRVDAVVTDPPYHLQSIQKRFGGKNAAPAKHGHDGAFSRLSRGFMGKEWDGGDIAFDPEFWSLVLDVLKPGGHALIFGGTRTYHRMACAVEDAGFEVRDRFLNLMEPQTKYGPLIESLTEDQRSQLAELLSEVGGTGEWHWVHGSGFPKTRDMGKEIDRMAGAEREKVGEVVLAGSAAYGDGQGGFYAMQGISGKKKVEVTAPATDEAKRWEGWKIALKPAHEIVLMARKPIAERNAAANVLSYGTGALNVDGCRVPGQPPLATQGEGGRYPANVIHDGSEEATAGLGEAQRYFYSAKANKHDRDCGGRGRTEHPTVKPLPLLRYLANLITPPYGLVLDPFAGTGTTLEACICNGFNAVGIEREGEYVADIKGRLGKYAPGQDGEEA